MNSLPPGLETPGEVDWIVRTLEDAGHETWTVGGAVRDALSGRPSEDWDLATRARPAEVQRLFRKTVPIGIDHGTVGVLASTGILYEVTTFRRDVETTGRHAVVAFADELEDDLARRDFTINAVAWHPLRQEIRDPWGGLHDLAQGCLRTVGDPVDRFAEDYLRILRGLRFAGRFQLRVEPDTWRALCDAVPRMGDLSAERVREELDKALGHLDGADRILSLYAASGALGFLYPEWADRVGEGVPEGGDRWSRALRAVRWAGRGAVGARVEDRLAVLLAQVTHPGQPDPFAATVRASLALLGRLRSSNARLRSVAARAAGAASPPGVDAQGPELRGWLRQVGRPDAPAAIRAMTASLAARMVRGGAGPDGRRELASLVRRLRRELASGAPLSEKELALNGRDLIRAGFAPGPRFGRVFELLLDEVVEDPDLNDAPRLLERARVLLDDEGDNTSGFGRGA